MINRMIRKVSLLVSLTMALSLLVSIAAYAATEFKGVTKSSDGVTGWVYSDHNLGNAVTIQAYGNNGFVDNVTSNAYSVVDSVYHGVYTDVYGTVYNDTYTTSSYRYFFHHIVNANTNDDLLYRFGGSESGPYNFTSSYGGGGGVPVEEKPPLKGNVAVELKDGQALINVSDLIKAEAGSTITFSSTLGNYELPVSLLSFDKLAEELGTPAADLKLIVQIKDVSNGDKSSLENSAKALGKKLLGVPVEFVIKVEGNDGKSVTISNFGQYVKRVLKLSGTINPSKTVGVLFDPITNKVKFIPTVFKDGEAIMLSRSNSIYAVLESEVTFSDLNGHWAKADVELLANKLIVEGSNGKFDPSGNITRAEAASLITRALALKSSVSATGLTDVAADAWYAESVNAAFEAGIIKGYKDGQFKPEAIATRSEFASMLSRALQIAGKKLSLTDAEVNEALGAFVDKSELGWAKADMAVAVKAGIISGSKGELSGEETANRAQAAVMLSHFLSYVEFI
ncbi:S-layer homology domain-containing protein [Cohnella luojiensis]|uniref:S-layer homology domain-containing protein n=1 Tax=Cohnella luojiensis TaxID=652876 RepID=A0A4Y8M1M1_9BACL|nr:S-layer homology domain-containing protein [Cohnella luojiensis]TFE29013.1 S-layer homology domain-containing protein [Cohnella luojiensis]